MSKKKNRVGFLSYFGYGRGLAHSTLCHAKMLIPEYEVYIMKQGKNVIADYFNIDVNITEIKHPYHPTEEEFRNWIINNELDVVIFDEYNQWDALRSPNDLPKIAKELGCKVYGVLVMEKFNKKQTYTYDRILVRSVTMERYMRANKVRNFTYAPYSLDLTEFPQPVYKKNDKFTFFHPGGFGGVHDRKNTWAVIEAFEMLPNVDECKLIITSQKQLQFSRELHPNIEIVDKDLSRDELIKYFYKSDATVLPSKWETIGIPILESLASGTPVITTNVPPMNEFIRTGLNGYLTTPKEMIKYVDISVYSAEIDIVDLKNKMENIMNEMLHPILCKNSREVVERLYNIETNKEYLLSFLRGELK